MLKMHIISTRITFKFMLWLAVPVGVAVVVFGVDPVIDRDVELTQMMTSSLDCFLMFSQR